MVNTSANMTLKDGIYELEKIRNMELDEWITFSEFHSWGLNESASIQEIVDILLNAKFHVVGHTLGITCRRDEDSHTALSAYFPDFKLADGKYNFSQKFFEVFGLGSSIQVATADTFIFADKQVSNFELFYSIP